MNIMGQRTWHIWLKHTRCGGNDVTYRDTVLLTSLMFGQLPLLAGCDAPTPYVHPIPKCAISHGQAAIRTSHPTLVLILPGVKGGRDRPIHELTAAVERDCNQRGATASMHVWDWTEVEEVPVSNAFIFAPPEHAEQAFFGALRQYSESLRINLTDEARNRRRAHQLWQQLRTWYTAYRRGPHECRLLLIALSGGAEIARLMCEENQAHGDQAISFDGIILIAPAITVDKNLSPLLRSTRACFNFFCRGDRVLLLGEQNYLKNETIGRTGVSVQYARRISQIEYAGNHLGVLEESRIGNQVIPIVSRYYSEQSRHPR